MKALIRALLALTLIGILPTVAVTDEIAPAPDPGSAIVVEGGSELWLVELTGRPTADGGQPAAIDAEHANFRHKATAAGLRFTERHAFRTLWNGFSIAVDPGDLSNLESLDGVAAIYPVVSLTIPESEEIAEPQLLSALSMTGADVAQNELGLTGAGVRVGIIDTGIDYDHPDLGGDGVQRVNSNVFPTARVVAGWDFGQAFNPQPDPYPDDDIGHGTHVAGIIGAHGAVRGAAPGVVFGAYRVTTADQMIAAMERALADEMQIVNISMGFPRQWPLYPVARAADRLVQRGVVVTASIGNEGGFSVYTASAPAVGDKVIGVASFDNTFRNVPAFTASPDQAPFIFTPATFSPGPNITPLRSGTYRLSTGLEVAGKVALYRPFPCAPCPPPDYAAARLAQEHGAVAVVLHSEILEFFPARVNVPAGSPPITIPVVSIKRAEAQQLLIRMNQSPVDITWHEALSLPVASGGRVSSMSSWGPSPDLELKPDLGAPGGFMHSTYPLELGGIANLAGTSMASAHVAGAVALMLESEPRLKPRAIHTALQNSARPGPTAADPSRIEPVHHQGAGLIDVVAAIQTPIKIEPAALSLGESDGAAVTRQITIENDSDTDLSYQVRHQPAQATGPNRYVPIFSDLSGLVIFSQQLFTVPAHGSITIDVSIAPDPGLEDRSLYGGYIVLAPQGEGRSYSVPYIGFKGDYQSIPTLTPTANGYPWLARDRPDDLPRVLLKVSDGWTYRMTKSRQATVGSLASRPSTLSLAAGSVRRGDQSAVAPDHRPQVVELGSYRRLRSSLHGGSHFSRESDRDRARRGVRNEDVWCSVVSVTRTTPRTGRAGPRRASSSIDPTYWSSV